MTVLTSMENALGNIGDSTPVTPYGGDENHLHRIAATIPGMLYDYVLNSDGSSKFLYVGPKCREILELNEQDLLADAGLFWELVLAEDMQRLKSEDAAANHEGESFSAEVRIRTRSGCLKWIQLSSKPNPALPGELVVWSGFMLDITKRKQIEAELEQHRNHLEELVKDRTAALSIAKEAAEAASRAKTIFLTTMSHELRTPMNGIMGMAALALRRATDPKQVEYLDKLNLVSQSLLGTINNVLDIANIESKRLTLENVDFRLGGVLENIKAVSAPQARQKGLALQIDVSAELACMPLRSDPVRLGQVLQNLTNNAIRFTDTGSITVRVRQVKDSLANTVLRFEVQDSGIGIAAKDQKRIFTPFEQVDGSMTRQYSGSGLGLAISNRLIQLMGGEISVESQPGVGSTFWLSIQFAKSADAVPPAPAFKMANATTERAMSQ